MGHHGGFKRPMPAKRGPADELNVCLRKSTQVLQFQPDVRVSDAGGFISLFLNIKNVVKLSIRFLNNAVVYLCFCYIIWQCWVEYF